MSGFFKRMRFVQFSPNRKDIINRVYFSRFDLNILLCLTIDPKKRSGLKEMKQSDIGDEILLPGETIIRRMT